ncbi:hypothetical protein [Alishewanella longhuensis]
MALLAKGIKLCCWALTALVALLLIFYTALFVINLSDETPAEPALSLLRVTEPHLEQINKLQAAENAYQYYIERATLPEYQLSAELSAIVQACRSKDCSELLTEKSSQLPALLAEQQALLDLYQSLLTIAVWHEIIPAAATELPPYQPLLHAQSVFLLQAWVAAQQNDLVMAQKILDDDLRFWRMLLKNNRLMISKVISVRAIRQHFDFATLLRQSLTAEQQLTFTPTAWQRPFSEAELSMYFVFAGEWHFANQLVESMWQQELAAQTAPWYEQLLTVLLQPLFKKQATKNELARVYLHCSEGMPAARSPWYSWFYNPVGKLLNRAGVSGYCGQYNDELQQLEVRRLQLLG